MITVKTKVNASLEKVWNYFTNPKHIMNWNYASHDWHCPKAENNLEKNGKFCYTMAAKDGSFSFEFQGKYTEIILHEIIKYTIEDGRKVEIYFKKYNDEIEIIENFEPENMNSLELQHDGWQAILNNLKKYIETT